jgi:hypothetical protein
MEAPSANMSRGAAAARDIENEERTGMCAGGERKIRRGYRTSVMASRRESQGPSMRTTRAAMDALPKRKIFNPGFGFP